MSPNGRGIARTLILSTLADATYASLPQGTRAMVPAHVPASAFWVLGHTNQGQSAGMAGGTWESLPDSCAVLQCLSTCKYEIDVTPSHPQVTFITDHNTHLISLTYSSGDSSSVSHTPYI